MKKTDFGLSTDTENEFRNRNLEALTDEELLDFARRVSGSSALPFLPSVPSAFNRLAAMIDENEDES